MQAINEKIDGLKQEIKGKIKHDPELVERGRQQRTGELKRKEMKEVNPSSSSLATILSGAFSVGARSPQSVR